VKSTTKDPAEDGLEFYVGLEHLDPQSLRIARKGIIAEDNPSFTRRFSAGQILFGKRRCYQKKAAVADFDGICSGDIIVMDAIPKKIIPGLLPFIIQSDAFFDWAEKTSSGSLSPRTRKNEGSKMRK
jgi:type I restriction enzyme S subunit